MDEPLQTEPAGTSSGDVYQRSESRSAEPSDLTLTALPSGTAAHMGSMSAQPQPVSAAMSGVLWKLSPHST